MPCFLPVPAVLGGAVQTLVESLLEQNEHRKEMELTILTSFNKVAEIKSRKYRNTEFIWFSQSSIGRILDRLISSKCYFRKLEVIKRAKEVLGNNNYDSVVLQNSGFLLKIFSNQKLRTKYKNRIFYHLHNDIPIGVNIELAKQCNLLLISHYLKKEIVNQLGKEMLDRCVVVNNGINVSKFSHSLLMEEKEELKKKLNIPPNNRIVIFVGRLVPEKGIIELLNAFKLLKNRDITLLIIGSANFGANKLSKFELELKNKIKGLNERICFTGFVHNDELWKYYKISDVAVLPSIWDEPAGLTMVEAAVCGLPVITTNSGGIPEYVGNSKQTIILERDEKLVRNITNSIESILANKEYWERVSEQEHIIIKEHYSEEKYYTNFVNSISRFV